MGWLCPEKCESCQSEFSRSEGCLTQRGGFCKDFSAWRPKYEVIHAMNIRMLEIIKFYADTSNWEYCNEDYPSDDGFQARIVEEDISKKDGLGGKMAREFIKELEGE